MPTGIPLLNPPRFKPTRDRQMDTRSVECPDCKSAPRVGCVNLATGEPRTSSHPARRRMAVRADNEARGIS